MSDHTDTKHRIATLGDEQSVQVTQALTTVLADHVVFWMKLQNAHWNVFGPLFIQVHDLTERHYRVVFEAIDDIAERIRALGHPVPGRIGYLAERSHLSENGDGRLLEDLLEASEQIGQTTRSAHDRSSDLGDEGSCDLLIGLVRAHDEFAWQLRSLLA